jgi:predicted TPR repeat methyltransferase
MEESPDALREVSFEEAMAMAIFFQKHGHLDDAQQVYSKLAEVFPEHPDVLHYSGVLAHQQGRHDAAVELIERSLTLQPDQAGCYNNLGIIYKNAGRIDEAIVAYERAIALDRNHANAHNNLGVLFKAQNRMVEAESAYRTAIDLDEGYSDAYHNLGILLSYLRRTEEAVKCFCKAITLTRHHPEARRLLALAYCTLGQQDKAVEIYEQWLKDNPGDVIAEHMLAACSGVNVPLRASDVYVERSFDDFAATFESKLAHLSYRAPALVGGALAQAAGTPAKAFDVLDAGCGTGLCAAYLAPYARQLIGVDLSAGMLAQAKEKNLYDELVKSELTEYIASCRRAFDVIVSADTLCYFGGLEDVATTVSAALRPGGRFIFTAEELVGAAERDFQIRVHGRYAHSAAYIDRVLTTFGFDVEIAHAELRMESGRPVQGLVVRALSEGPR